MTSRGNSPIWIVNTDPNRRSPPSVPFGVIQMNAITVGTKAVSGISRNAQDNMKAQPTNTWFDGSQVSRSDGQLA
jgi:hypothetical protein